MNTVERLRARRLRSEEDWEQGFTLIELLVVLLIIGILLAIAIPTFLSVTKSANNTAAQSNLQTAFTGAKTYFEGANQTYTNIEGPSSVSTILQVDTGLSFVSKATASTAANVVSVWTNGPDVVLVAFSTPTKDCWGILDNTASGGSQWTGYGGVGTYFGVKKNSTSGACTAASFAPGSVLSTGYPAG